MSRQGAPDAAWPDRVGVAGLGQLGLPVALRLLDTGHTVLGYARRPPREAFTRAGGQVCATPAELADQCPVVLSLLPSAEALAQVTAGSTGRTAATRRGGIWAEMSTLSEQSKQVAAGQLTEHGWQVLDCPISGTAAELGSAGAVIFSSGPRTACDQAQSVLQAITPQVRYMGEFGAGTRAKCVAQLLLAGHSLIAAEALAVAQAAGLTLAGFLDAVAGTIVSSAVLDKRGPQAQTLPTAGHGRARTLAGPLNTARQFAQNDGLPTPVLDQILSYVQALGKQSADEPLLAFCQQLMPPGPPHRQSPPAKGSP